MINYQKLEHNFFDRPVETVSEELLGKYLVHYLSQTDIRVGKIVETEAYLGPMDKASHSSRGKTARTEVLYGPAGFVYVYLIYGLHYLVNITCAGEGSAVLIRAIEPIQNLVGNSNGPGLVTKSLGIDKTAYGMSILGNQLFVAEPIPSNSAVEIVKTPRVGVDYAEEWASLPLRYYIAGNPFVSRT